MAKKKAAVKVKRPIPNLSAMTGPIGGPVPSAMTGSIGGPVPSAMGGPIGPSLIGANIGKAQQIDAVEQAQMVDTLRKRASERLTAKKKIEGDVSLGPTTTQATTAVPIDGGLNQPVVKKKLPIKKKKSY